jgi:diacylglycerol kinase
MGSPMKALAKSFGFACRGFIHCLHNERNMRIHLAFTLYMYSFLLFFDFFKIGKLELAVLFIANALVMMAELINTAIENTINLVEKKYNKMAQIAKDTAAAGVLVGALFAVAIGVALLWQPDAFKKMFDYYKEHIAMLVCLAASLAVSLVYIFIGPLALWGFLTGKPHTPKGKSNNMNGNKV